MQAAAVGIAFIKDGSKESQAWVKPWHKIFRLGDLPQILVEIEQNNDVCGPQ